MSDNQNFGFGKFVPGFDFLQSLTQGASQSLPQMPSLSNWVAPTLSLEEVEKRIGELRAVHFWLDQNSKALGATIQALEVQKMTLATLKGMNFNMSEVADALKLKTAEVMFGGAPKSSERPAASAQAEPTAGKRKPAAKKSAQAQAQPAVGVVDPMQWWGALTQQFQQIAQAAMKDATVQGAAAAAGAAQAAAAQPAGHKLRPSRRPAAKK